MPELPTMPNFLLNNSTGSDWKSERSDKSVAEEHTYFFTKDENWEDFFQPADFSDRMARKSWRELANYIGVVYIYSDSQFSALPHRQQNRKNGGQRNGWITPPAPASSHNPLPTMYCTVQYTVLTRSWHIDYNFLHTLNNPFIIYSWQGTNT